MDLTGVRHRTHVLLVYYVHCTLGLLPESNHSSVQKVLADKVMKVDASLEFCVVDLAGSTGGVECVLLSVPCLRLLLERVQQETHLCVCEGGGLGECMWTPNEFKFTYTFVVI